jgi:hypothetical protein
LILLISIFFSFFILGFKFIVTKTLAIPAFCDIRSNWTEFDSLVITGNYTLLEPVICFEKCTFNGYILTKIFQIDFLITYMIALALCFIEMKLVRHFIMKIAICIVPFAFVVGNLIFFYNKILTLSVTNIIIISVMSMIIFKGFDYYKICCVLMGGGVMYFSIIKFFYEYGFLYIYNLNPHIIMTIFPILNSFFQTIFFKIISYFTLFKRATPPIKIFIIFYTMLFEYLHIGNLFILITEGFGNYSLWFNLMINFILDIDKKFMWSMRLTNFILNKYKKEQKPLLINDYLLIYLELKFEMEIFSVFLFLWLIIFKYFDWASNSIVDCMGRPLSSIVKIDYKHYILALIMISYSFSKLIIKKMIVKWLYKGIEYGHFPKFMKMRDYFLFVIPLNGLSINFGYMGLYAVMFLKSNQL